MKRTLIITILFLGLASCYAQERFIKFLDSGPLLRNEIFDIYFDTTDNFIYALANHIDSTNFYNLKLIKLDTLGNIVWETIHSGDGWNDYILNSRNNVEKITPNSFALCSQKFKEGVTFFLEFDRNGNILHEIEYPLREDLVHKVPKTILSIDSNYIFIAGNEQKKYTLLINYWLKKIDLSGNIVWEKSYGDENNRDEFFEELKKTDEGEMILSGVSIFRLFGEVDSKYVLFEVDSSGQILNELHSQTDSNDGKISGVIQFKSEDNQKRYAFACSRSVFDDFSQLFRSTIRYFITNEDGSIIDSSSYGNGISLFNSLQLNEQTEGCFIAAGQMTDEDLNHYPVIAKFNENADTIWWRWFDINPNPSAFDGMRVTGLQIMPTGSILVSGNLLVYPEGGVEVISKPFIMKLDKYGCLEEGCHLINSNFQTLFINEFKISPNPVQNTLFLSTDLPIQHYNISSLSGNVLQKRSYESTIDVSTLVSGLYFITVWDAAGNSATKRFVKLN